MNAFYIPDRVVDYGGDNTIESFAVHHPSIETVGLPHRLSEGSLY
jgi:hypothetical protein